MAPGLGRVIFLLLAAARAGAEEQDTAEGAPENATTKPYVRPEVDGLHWAETFDGDVWSRWKLSSHEKYNGKFAVEPRRREALVGDVGLLITEEAKHYGASATFKPLEGKKEVPFVVQFEAKFQDGLSCGGSYIKLYDSTGVETFHADTPYVIMFGPDRCGSTDKVHFILRHRNPKTGEWQEKHAKDPPSVPHDNLSHLYGLVINPDNTFEVLIDGEKKSSGSLLTSMDPPINPPKEIDDPEDKKPQDWVDEAKMDDPASTKPDDWDEDAPKMIPDPKSSKPSGWNDDAPKKIPDPKARKPDDWDDDEDGEWEAPMIDNPDCSVGCGKWEAPKISNPAYKGKWHAAKIDNPAYKGVWKPRQIPNPDYFVDESPCVLPKIDSVGIDIWTMSKGILFDNIVLATDPSKARAFADDSFMPRRELEKLQQPKPDKGGFLDTAWQFVSRNFIATAVTTAVLVVTSVWCCCLRGGSRTDSPEARRLERRKKEAARKAEREAAAAKNGEGEAKAGEGEGEGEGAAAEAVPATEGDISGNTAPSAEEEVEGKMAQDPVEKKEGGLGDLTKED